MFLAIDLLYIKCYNKSTDYICIYGVDFNMAASKTNSGKTNDMLTRIGELEQDRIHVMHIEQETLEKHWHNYYEMVYISEGRILHHINNNAVEVKKGDFYIIDINDAHSYESFAGEACYLYNVLFYPEFIDTTLKNCYHFSQLIENYLIKFDESILKYNPTKYLYHDDDGMILGLIKKIEKEYTEKKHGFVELMRCNLIEILILTMRKIIDDEKYIKKNSITEYIIKYIESGYNEKISLSDIAAQLNYSLPYLSLRFKEDTGFLFSEYLQKKRIEEGARMIANTEKKIGDIASSVGYDDVKFFNRIFKKYMNTTPAAYRKINARK